MYGNMVIQRQDDGHQKSTDNLVLKEQLLETRISSTRRILKVRKE